MSASRYAVGIDLGTTHCALSYVDLEESHAEELAQSLMPLSQLTAPGAVEERSLLPSFLYLPHAEEFAAQDLRLPWKARLDVVGELARTVGALLGRLQRYVADVKADINREVELEELRKMKDSVQQAASEFESSMSEDLRKAEGDLNRAVSEAAGETQHEPAAALDKPDTSEAHGTSR